MENQRTALQHPARVPLWAFSMQGTNSQVQPTTTPDRHGRQPLQCGSGPAQASAPRAHHARDNSSCKLRLYSLAQRSLLPSLELLDVLLPVPPVVTTPIGRRLQLGQQHALMLCACCVKTATYVSLLPRPGWNVGHWKLCQK